MYPTWRRDHFFEVDGSKGQVTHHVSLSLSFTTDSHETREALQGISSQTHDRINTAITKCLEAIAAALKETR